MRAVNTTARMTENSGMAPCSLSLVFPFLTNTRLSHLQPRSFSEFMFPHSEIIKLSIHLNIYSNPWRPQSGSQAHGTTPSVE